MGKENDRLSKRLSAITSAKPIDAPKAPPSLAPNRGPRRKEPRDPTYRFARLTLSRQTVLRCIVRDISASGARVALDNASELPGEVILVIDQAGRRYRARVAWRSETEAGLCFLGEVAPEGALRKDDEKAPRAGPDKPP